MSSVNKYLPAKYLKNDENRDEDLPKKAESIRTDTKKTESPIKKTDFSGLGEDKLSQVTNFDASSEKLEKIRNPKIEPEPKEEQNSETRTVKPELKTTPIPKKKKKRNLTGVLALLFLVVGVGASYFLVRQNQDLRQQASVVNDEDPYSQNYDPTVTASPTVSETTNVNTLRCGSSDIRYFGTKQICEQSCQDGTCIDAVDGTTGVCCQKENNITFSCPANTERYDYASLCAQECSQKCLNLVGSNGTEGDSLCCPTGTTTTDSSSSYQDSSTVTYSGLTCSESSVEICKGVKEGSSVNSCIPVSTSDCSSGYAYWTCKDYGGYCRTLGNCMTTSEARVCTGGGGTVTDTSCANGETFAGQCIKYTCNACSESGGDWSCGENSPGATWEKGACSDLKCDDGQCCQIDPISTKGNYCLLDDWGGTAFCPVSCQTGGSNPTPTNPPTTTTPTSTPEAIRCASIDMLNADNTVMTEDDDSSLALGDQITFMCTSSGTTTGEISYEFRILTPAGEWLDISNTSTVTNPNVSNAYTIDSYGSFTAQARICVDGVCEDWDTL
jgi:hypothetical protein